MQIFAGAGEDEAGEPIDDDEQEAEEEQALAGAHEGDDFGQGFPGDLFLFGRGVGHGAPWLKMYSLFDARAGGESI